MKRRKIYSGSFKAKVVLELLNGKKSLNELARQYQLHPNQIKNWKSILLKHASYILEDKRKRIKDDDIAQMRNL
jgi:transposase-like protein